MSRADELRREIGIIDALTKGGGSGRRRQLQAAIAKLEERMASIPPGDRRHRRRAEWERMLERVEALTEKLTGADEDAPTSPLPLAQLRRAMRELVGLIRADPFGKSNEADALTRRIAELVRGRRDGLAEVVTRLEDARSYSVDVSARLETLIADIAPGGSLAAAPLKDLRSDLTRRVEMAEIAFEEARDRVTALSVSWPELAPLAERRDWHAIPFLRVRQLIMDDPTATKAGKGPPVTADLREALSTSRAIALWVEELRQAVLKAPPVA